MRYVVSYDLNRPIQNYPQLTQALVALGAKRILLSQWLVRTNTYNASTLCRHLWTFMDGNDRLLVTGFDTTEAAWYNLMLDPNTIAA